MTIAAAGSKGKLQIWDVGTNSGARKALSSKFAETGRELREKSGGGLVGVASDDEEESEDGGE